MENDNKIIETVSKESGLYNINVECNSKEGKMLIEVVNKETSLENK